MLKWPFCELTLVEHSHHESNYHIDSEYAKQEPEPELDLAAQRRRFIIIKYNVIPASTTHNVV